MKISERLKESTILRSGLLVATGVAAGAVLMLGLRAGPDSGPTTALTTDETSSASASQAARSPAPAPAQTLNANAEPGCFVGALVPREEADVAAEIEGILEGLNVRVGDRVQVGDPLATLDTRALSHQLAIEEANLKSAEAERKKQSIEVQRAAQEEQRRLALSGLVSREEGEAAAFRASSAKASLEAAEARSNQVQARIDEISDILSRSVLRAPFTGLISRRYLDPGSRTLVGTPVVRLVRLDDLMVRFAVPLEVAEDLEPGDSIRAELVNERSAWSGVVEQIAPEIDPAALLVFVEARLETPNPSAESGADSLVFGTEARVSLTDPGQDPPKCLTTEPKSAAAVGAGLAPTRSSELKLQDR